jgi:hypothetical protein
MRSLHIIFGERKIRRGMWSLCSTNLFQCGIYLWRTSKEPTYSNNPCTEDDLKESISTYNGPSIVKRFDVQTTWNLNKKIEKNSVWNSNKNSKVKPWARHCTASCGSFHRESTNKNAASWVLLVGLSISASSSPVITA